MYAKKKFLHVDPSYTVSCSRLENVVLKVVIVTGKYEGLNLYDTEKVYI